MNLPEPDPLSLILAANYVLAALCIFRILLSYRTAQGAVAWTIALATIPFIPVLAYALFGRNRLRGYLRARRTGDADVNQLIVELHRDEGPTLEAPPAHSPELRALAELVRLPFVSGNRCSLLENGHATFGALFQALEDAREYILLEFYIVRSDRVGQRLKRMLTAKVRQGVRVYFIYDEIGSVWLSWRYLRELRNAGVQVVPFGSANGRRRRFELNFRNHRKLLVCDGRVGFIGGINLGDEYMSKSIEWGDWRDTHCRIEGSAVMAIQLAFVEDWYWATNSLPELSWEARPAPGGSQQVLILPTGPADEMETGALFFLNCISHARRRLWIATPYFVPDLQIVNALQLASLRGVDVRILIPEKTDNPLVSLAAYTYLEQAERAGIGVYRYQPGFMHQKVLLVDDRYAAVGTANLDNRSMRLNFEITALVPDPRFVAQVERMLRADFERSIPLGPEDYRERSLLFRVAARSVRLLAPLL